ncbi:MAG: hydroxyacylglutathione hydrolase [Betaproteobacteria bacterium]|nr:hydroxyacylglutathione hydrolase [Betaproteobacteria bacterium]
MNISPIRAFRDNYIWVMRRGDLAVVVDPGDAQPVIRFVEENGVRLLAVLVTHHHGDHVGGLDDLGARYRMPVYGPWHEEIDGVTNPLRHGDFVDVPELELNLRVIEVPGHTRGHIAYYGANALLCGDTLFGCGCGRLFEGTPAMMLDSLQRLSALPGDANVYCAHEYTESNCRFALAVEPDNARLRERVAAVAQLRGSDIPTVPSTLEEERATNPFLRTEQPAVRRAAERFLGRRPGDEVEVFAAIRAWKNNF